ncbi:MAG: Acyl-CoA N-acyltransferase [Candidatus Falkowbacteria bacterium GW2011_GWC2_38_22]|uniref:Acyl-CoA N-acyltransferase n=1 Tax=Candidatus Falkowbacteria bacterium GW2011_GWE1_38_31 TaxID=1618638 RepID=A0A0G0JUG0_9BACT|nr:MAG: Acyl-CoA N-acyltransferase [Candidatus Falkowbacteria bacterium GW2011_GWF2_38_1205]KKQ61376.1 MAG: Acyl-CoA N-acyltransferase [Candidatus Falkowbacteria bacterium GW2011_GWC2_38_22]KKQ64042.1 MAG: Acyl-CoA N-acyltransferase [Candidatus Falkowbacteria bacterium GW2011_GWF1_38_22]KKQ66609.1 MAG: Acyl-CoA N-acyltransferase [Candidatus Falkowbacteria bacterium GW2011_GWE2_38_254]KKQ71148.1 MAG: Acyl-CoA N-acyltransferase [Candidatus Falkowbacteria bacterium GW2011_GWE1_38_31]KKQ73274.1 MA
MNYKIKKLKKSDWKLYKEIRLEALKNEPSAFGSSYDTEFKRSDEDWQKKFKDIESSKSSKFYYAAQIDEKLVAIGGAFQEENNEWNIIAIYTKPNNRGKGIGNKLLSSIREELKIRKTLKAFLRVNVDQLAAISLYKKLGFTILDTHKDQLLGDGKYYDEYEMVCEIK